MSNALCKRAIQRLWEEGFNQGNWAVIDEICHAAHVLHDLGWPEAPQGPDGLRQALRAYRLAVPNGRVTLDELFGRPGKLIARWTLHGHGAEPGRRLVGTSVHRFENGQLVETWSHARPASEAALLTG